MNKLILCLLLVCLINVSVHAFVKRDAPAETNQLNDIMKQLQDWGKTVGEKVQENFNPDKIKEDWQKISKQIEDGIAKIKPTETKA